MAALERNYAKTLSIVILANRNILPKDSTCWMMLSAFIQENINLIIHAGAFRELEIKNQAPLVLRRNCIQAVHHEIRHVLVDLSGDPS